jgi:arylsulfatase A
MNKSERLCKGGMYIMNGCVEKNGRKKTMTIPNIQTAGIRAAAGAVIGVCSIAPASAFMQISSEASQRPNVILILADDLGWMDLSCQGSSYYQTPFIDSMASEGIRFTNAYASGPLCSASRASILTGQMTTRTGITSTVPYTHTEPRFFRTSQEWSRIVPPPQFSELQHDFITFPEVLKDNGYITAHIGKWHLGTEPWYPQHHGFDINLGGTFRGASPYYNFNLDEIVAADSNEYLTDRLTDEAVRFIRSSNDQPFFLQLAHFAVHGPMQAKPEKIEKYKKCIPEGSKQNNPVYAAMVESLDESVGRVLQALREEKLLDNTLVIFTSDNGGVTLRPNGERWTSNEPLRSQKMDIYEGGIRVPFIAFGPGVKSGQVSAVPVIGYDIFPTVLAYCHIPLPEGNPCDGRSLLPLFEGQADQEEVPVYWYYPNFAPKEETYWGEPRAAVRKGGWKLIQVFEGPAELYNLDQDIGESCNLIDQYPEVAAEMKTLLESKLKSSIPDGWYPVANPKYNPQARPPIDEWNKRLGRKLD